MKKAFTLVEVILSVSFISIMLASIIFGYMTILKLEIKAKAKVYNTFKEVNEISKKNYITEIEF